MSKKFVIERIEDLLKPIGFRRHKDSWSRQSGPFVDVIDFQISKAKDALTLNAGVLHIDIYEKCWGGKPPEVIEEPFCTVRFRIGELLGEKDFWWQLTDPKILNDISEKITKHILPSLEKSHSLKAMEEILMATQVTRQKYPPPIIYLAILKYELGDIRGASELLSDLRKKTSEPWQVRIDDVFNRIKCY